MPFGKYRNVDTTDLPEHYLVWLLDWPPLRDPLRSVVEDELRRREGLRARQPVKIDVALADQIVRAGVRQLAKQIHPDIAGGDNDAMMKVNATADLIRELVAQCG
jgi:Putative quorum-sensing-regulated virulence factor